MNRLAVFFMFCLMALFFESCQKDSQIPSITTLSPEEITNTSVILNAEIIDDGGVPVTERGFYYGVSTSPETDGVKIECGSGRDSFSSNVSNLQPGETYYVKAYAINKNGEALGSEESFKAVISNIELITVQGDTFEMGSNNGHLDERPVHRVTLSTFKISKHEITYAQYIEFLNAINCNSNGSYVDNEFGTIEYIKMNYPDCEIGYAGSSFYFKRRGEAVTEDCPVRVSWYGANAYCKWAGGRLPTEAEWEFAARGGNSSNDYTYSGSNNLDEIAWYSSNSGGKTYPVGRKKANKLGLYDMTGNVWEWCSDWSSISYYSSSPALNPQGPPTGNRRVMRGGSWHDDAYYCRVALRASFPPAISEYPVGFRLVIP